MHCFSILKKTIQMREVKGLEDICSFSATRYWLKNRSTCYRQDVRKRKQACNLAHDFNPHPHPSTDGGARNSDVSWKRSRLNFSPARTNAQQQITSCAQLKHRPRALGTDVCKTRTAAGSCQCFLFFCFFGFVVFFFCTWCLLEIFHLLPILLQLQLNTLKTA